MKVDFTYDLNTAVPSDEDFYRLWKPKVQGMARNLRLLDPETVAQDVVVDFLASGYIHQWDVSKGKSFDSFCFWMMRNRLYSKLRQQKRANERCVGGYEHTDEADAVFAPQLRAVYEQAEFEHVEQRVDLRALAEEIGGRPGQILATLTDFTEAGTEMRDQDVAHAMGCSGTTVQMHRQKLRIALRATDQDVLAVPT